MLLAHYAAVAVMLSGCVLSWEVPEGTCDLCAPGPIYANTNCDDQLPQSFGWLWEAGNCSEIEACTCVGCEKLPQTQAECEERGNEVCDSTLCPGGFD